MRLFEITMLCIDGNITRYFSSGSCIGAVLVSLSSEYSSFKIEDVDSIVEIKL